MEDKNKILDKKDWHILSLLCENARLSHNQIAKKVMLSKNAVTYRINRLIKKGIVKGFFTIIDHHLFGLNFYEVLLKVNASESDKIKLIEYIQAHPNVIVLDKLSGEWNFVLEFGCKSSEQFFQIINELESKFSGIIDYFEVHPVLHSYKVEQLPIELAKPIQHKEFKGERNITKIDKKDRQLLLELSKNSSSPLYEIAEKLKTTYETIAARIKKLKEKGVILKFTAKIGLYMLGYEVYLLIIDIKNLHKEEEKRLRGYLVASKNIRYAFMSASKPQLFIYFASKNSDELDSFMNNIKKDFPDQIYNQKYLLSKQQYKYELFTEGFLD